MNEYARALREAIPPGRRCAMPVGGMQRFSRTASAGSYQPLVAVATRSTDSMMERTDGPIRRLWPMSAKVRKGMPGADAAAFRERFRAQLFDPRFDIMPTAVEGAAAIAFSAYRDKRFT